MNRRIQQFIELEALSPARFSEILGIQRSGLSHILSGRNKPSFDFIERMLTKFPALNAEWLITGKGKPYKDLSSFIQQPVAETENTKEIAGNKEVTHVSEQKQLFENTLFDDIPYNDTHFFNPEEDIPERKPINSDNRTITRITVFYSDGTFEER